MDKEQIIKKFSMIPHEEGGYYAEIWHSPKIHDQRYLSSMIYYLLPQNQRCKWHRLTSDEIWLLHQGEEVTIILGGTDNTPQEEERITIGKDVFHFVIPAGTWQSAIANKGDALLSCVVSPGYDQRDWEIYQGEIL